MDFESVWVRVVGLKPVTSNNFRPMSASEIATVETALGTPLLDEYRMFLTKYGASTFRKDVRFSPSIRLPKTISSSGSDCIDAFYGTEPAGRDAYSLLHRISFYRGRMPDGVIPIGDNGLGNQICLGLAGKLCGQVLYWDRNTEVVEEDYIEDYGHPPTHEERFSNIHPIASSFAEFLQGLTPDQEK